MTLSPLARPEPLPEDRDEPNLLAGLRNGAWLDAQSFPALIYQVHMLITEGFCLLVGPPKIGKSWFVLSVALAIASGGVALGCIPVEQRPVLYLALEDGDRRLQERCRTLLCGSPIPELFTYMTVVTPGAVVATIEQWLAIYGGDRPLVILDTLGKVMPPALVGESAYQRDYRVGGALKRVVDAHPGAALLVNHHDRKATSDDFVDAVSGTHGLAGAADTIIVLGRNRHETDGLLKVTGRDICEGEYALRFTEAAWVLDGGSLDEAASKAAIRRSAADLGDRSVDILTFVAQHPGGVNAGTVEARFGEGTRRYLARLAEAGKLQKLSRGLYAPLSQASQRPKPVPPDQPLWDNGTDETPPRTGPDGGHPADDSGLAS